MIRLIFKNFADNLVQILAMTYGERLFSLERPTDHGAEALKLCKVFDLKEFRYLKISHDLKGEHCCFFHFLLGKKRNMANRNELEVGSPEGARTPQGLR